MGHQQATLVASMMQGQQQQTQTLVDSMVAAVGRLRPLHPPPPLPPAANTWAAPAAEQWQAQPWQAPAAEQATQPWQAQPWQAPAMAGTAWALSGQAQPWQAPAAEQATQPWAEAADSGETPPMPAPRLFQEDSEDFGERDKDRDTHTHTQGIQSEGFPHAHIYIYI